MEQGSKVKVADQQKFKDRRVFLFEQIIIFSEEFEKKKNNLSQSSYLFKHSIKVGAANSTSIAVGLS